MDNSMGEERRLVRFDTSALHCIALMELDA